MHACRALLVSLGPSYSRLRFGHLCNVCLGKILVQIHYRYYLCIIRNCGSSRSLRSWSPREDATNRKYIAEVLGAADKISGYVALRAGLMRSTSIRECRLTWLAS